mmetsp:Transcript_15130/g.38959  ORF Transcript_15130/g.38959 Transcript_15130/m.38959 type:complete len:333 (+) Transcript_15130:323-1321(+)
MPSSSAGSSMLSSLLRSRPLPGPSRLSIALSISIGKRRLPERSPSSRLIVPAPPPLCCPKPPLMLNCPNELGSPCPLRTLLVAAWKSELDIMLNIAPLPPACGCCPLEPMPAWLGVMLGGEARLKLSILPMSCVDVICSPLPETIAAELAVTDTGGANGCCATAEKGEKAGLRRLPPAEPLLLAYACCCWAGWPYCPPPPWAPSKAEEALGSTRLSLGGDWPAPCTSWSTLSVELCISVLSNWSLSTGKMAQPTCPARHQLATAARCSVLTCCRWWCACWCSRMTSYCGSPPGIVSFFFCSSPTGRSRSISPLRQGKSTPTSIESSLYHTRR